MLESDHESDHEPYSRPTYGNELGHLDTKLGLVGLQNQT